MEGWREGWRVGSRKGASDRMESDEGRRLWGLNVENFSFL